MSTHRGGEGGRGMLSTLGLILIPLVCCGLPLLIVTGALGAIGSVLANPWVIAGVAAIGAGLLAWVLRFRRAASTDRDADCCAPVPPKGWGA